jgi:hypothetical protein
MDGCLQTLKCMSSLKRGSYDDDVVVATKSTCPVCRLALFGI